MVAILEDEEKSFERTLDRGIEHFKKAAEKSKENKVITGEDTFQLYDTYGFPTDLTQLMAAERGYTVDIKEFERFEIPPTNSLLFIVDHFYSQKIPPTVSFNC